MEKAFKSDFRFDNYVITHAQIDLDKNAPKPEDLTIEIKPKGLKEKERFVLTLDLSIKDDKSDFFINIVADAFFYFREDIPHDQIGKFFTLNAPAILFPYLRGYISMLTSLSGIGSVVLPVLNLTQLGKELAANIEVKE